MPTMYLLRRKIPLVPLFVEAQKSAGACVGVTIVELPKHNCDNLPCFLLLQLLFIQKLKYQETPTILFDCFFYIKIIHFRYPFQMRRFQQRQPFLPRLHPRPLRRLLPPFLAHPGG